MSGSQKSEIIKNHEEHNMFCYAENAYNLHFTNKNQKDSVIRNQWRILTWIFFFNRENKTTEAQRRELKVPVIPAAGSNHQISESSDFTAALRDRRNPAGQAF